jgi:DNA-binding NtrC family response regulator
LEAEYSELIGGEKQYPPRSLIYSRDLTRTLISTEKRDFPNVLIESVKKVSSRISANLFLRSEEDDSFCLVARSGRCRQGGRHSLPMLQRKHPAEPRVVTNNSGYALAVPLNTRERLGGFLYVERLGGGISELEFDSLTSIGDTGGLYLQGQLNPVMTAALSRTRFRLRNGQKIIGRDPRLLAMLDQIGKIAPLEANVLIEGETGAGKELVARAIHEQSGRIRTRYKPLNCSALPDHLVESELFGHSKGAFTGATRNKTGLFEAASGGTLFLDEISTLPLSLQSRLLRVLEEKKIRRVGDTEERRVNTRVIAATNENLGKLVKEGHFRRDLYHRLNVFLVEVPPLRDRLSDLEELSAHFLSQFSQESGKSVSISADAIRGLKKYHFPGNVRELRNLLESLFYTSQTGVITFKDIESRLSIEGISRSRSSSNQPSNILDSLIAGYGNFWNLVRDPFLKRDLSRKDVKWILSRGLEVCHGNYKELTIYFGMKPSDYKRFMTFLAKYECRVDFRPYRKNYGPKKKGNTIKHSSKASVKSSKS